ncbi:MAG: hypothetical protein AAGI17_00775 [Planctomycetota bacterium]
MPSRRLDIIPIIHTEADLGRLADRVKSIAIERGGEEEWNRARETIASIWDRIETYARGLPEKLGGSLEGVRLYQDGLPVCGRELELVRDLAGQRSRNHKLLLELVEQGAEIEGTESPDLLLEEYRAVKAAVEAGETQTAPDTDLLERRDRFIAERIDATLRESEVGVLFIGMLHNVQAFLADDIEVRTPLDPQSHAA